VTVGWWLCGLNADKTRTHGGLKTIERNGRRESRKQWGDGDDDDGDREIIELSWRGGAS
jgi:hypothetical protein